MRRVLLGFLFIYLALFSNFALAQKKQSQSIKKTPALLAYCKIEKPDFAVSFSFYENGSASIVGSILKEKFSCKLDGQEVEDAREHQANEKYKVLTLRSEANCNPTMSLDLKRGINVHVDLVVQEQGAELDVFEGHKRLPCDMFKYNEDAFLKLTKKKLRGVNSVAPKQKIVPLKIKSIQSLRLK